MYTVLTERLYQSLFLKKGPTQLFSCEYCEIFKNNFFEEHLRTAASAVLQTTQLTFSCLKSTIEILEKGVKYVQS